MIYKVIADDVTSRKKYVAPRSFDNSDFNKSYKAWIPRQTRVHTLGTNTEIQNAINKLFENVAEALYNKDGGVYMEDLGYFAFFMPEVKRFKTFKLDSYNYIKPNYKTNYYEFFPYLFGVDKLKGWSMEWAFTKELKNKYRNNPRYRKLYFKEVQSIFNKQE